MFAGDYETNSFLRARPKRVLEELTKGLAKAGTDGVSCLDFIEPITRAPSDHEIDARPVHSSIFRADTLLPEFSRKATIERLLEFIVSQIPLDLLVRLLDDRFSLLW